MGAFCQAAQPSSQSRAMRCRALVRVVVDAAKDVQIQGKAKHRLQLIEGMRQATRDAIMRPKMLLGARQLALVRLALTKPSVPSADRDAWFRRSSATALLDTYFEGAFAELSGVQEKVWQMQVGSYILDLQSDVGLYEKWSNMLSKYHQELSTALEAAGNNSSGDESGSDDNQDFLKAFCIHPQSHQSSGQTPQSEGYELVAPDGKSVDVVISTAHLPGEHKVGERHILLLLVEQPSERLRGQYSVASSDVCPSDSVSVGRRRPQLMSSEAQRTKLRASFFSSSRQSARVSTSSESPSPRSSLCK
ncbi:unnamed protein product [Effrenium voratum]|nr:unnamed protein product [Effrenium voratum]